MGFRQGSLLDPYKDPRGDRVKGVRAVLGVEVSGISASEVSFFLGEGSVFYGAWVSCGRWINTPLYPRPLPSKNP